MITVLILSPTPALRAGLRALLASDPDMSVTTAPDQVEELSLESGAPFASVIVATHGGVNLAGPALHPEQALLLVTGDAGEAQALAGLELRAWGIISPETTAEALQAAVRALAEGLVVASPDILRQALQGAGAPASPAGDNGVPDGEGLADPLTERENDVLLRLAQGLTNKQIALSLGISEHTVKFHVSSIYTKFGVSNRTEAVRKGARWGLVPL